MWDCSLIQRDYLAHPPLPLPIRDQKLDLVFADPPYNLGVEYADDPTGDRLDEDTFRLLVKRAMLTAVMSAHPGATVWWMCPENQGDWVGQMLTEIVGPRLHRIVWEESFAQYRGNRGLTKDYRFIFCHVVKGGTPTFNPDEIRVPSARQEVYRDKRANPAGRVPGCIWRFRRLQGTSKDRVDWHPCQLCPELLERIVRGWTNPGDLVGDLFAGSGSMGKVCRALGRRFVGVERSPTYIARMAAELLASHGPETEGR